MNKAEWIKKHGCKVRPATKKDKEAARTDYQRNADFIIQTPGGSEYYSKRGSLNDVKAALYMECDKEINRLRKLRRQCAPKR